MKPFALRRCLEAIGALVVAACALCAQAEFQNGASLGSPFIQSRVKTQILRQDDRADPACRARRFLRAQVVPKPITVTRNAIIERKWQELWTLDRCGARIGYKVYFTEVGKGGLYFSVRRTD